MANSDIIKAPNEAEGSEPSILASVLIDFGKERRSRIKDLKRGKGKLIDKVEDAIEQAVEELGEEANGKEILPVIVIVEKKPSKNKLPKLFNI